MCSETSAVEFLKFLFWNTSYCANCREAQIRYLRRRRPDIVALAEVGRNHLADYAESLAAFGLVQARQCSASRRASARSRQRAEPQPSHR
jgi:hypothetical protein